MARVAENVNELIGSDESTCLIIDESGFRKKGKKSVGVARQWLGNIGKVDNWVWVKDSGKSYQWHLLARRNAEDLCVLNSYLGL